MVSSTLLHAKQGLVHFHHLYVDERFVGIPTSYEDFITGTVSDFVNHSAQVIKGR